MSMSGTKLPASKMPRQSAAMACSRVIVFSPHVMFFMFSGEPRPFPAPRYVSGGTLAKDMGFAAAALDFRATREAHGTCFPCRPPSTAAGLATHHGRSRLAFTSWATGLSGAAEGRGALADIARIFASARDGLDCRVFKSRLALDWPSSAAHPRGRKFVTPPPCHPPGYRRDYGRSQSHA